MKKTSLKIVLSIFYLMTAFVGNNVFSRAQNHCNKIPQIKKDTVVFLSINDPHAALKQFPRLGYMVDSLRSVYPELLLVCGGDIQTGNPINDNYNPKGYPMIDLMNQLNFTLSVVGNHEFDSTPKGFGLLTHLANFDFLCANMHPSKEFGILIKPYVYRSLPNGRKIAFLGLIETSSNGIPATHPRNAIGTVFEDALKVADRYKMLKDSADAVVAITHLGLEADKQLLAQHRWIDFVIGGHSHTLIKDGTMYNGKPITQSQNKLRYCAISFMVFDEDGRISVETKTLEINPDHGKVNPFLTRLVERFYDNPEYSKLVAIASAPFMNYQQLGYLMADSYLYATKADFSIVNPGGVRINTLPAGDVNKLSVLTLDPFGNDMVTRMMTPEEIRQFLLQSWNIDSDLGPLLLGGLKLKAFFDGKENITKIEITTDDGSKLQEGKFYKVAYSSYIDSAYSFKHCKESSTTYNYTTAEATISFLTTLHKEGKKIPDYRNIQRYELIKK